MRTRHARSAGGRAMTSGRKPPWYPVAAATAVAALLAGGAMTLLMASRGSRDRPLADGCGLVTCAASLPREVTGAAPGVTAPGTEPALPRPTARQQPTAQPVLAPQAHPLRPRKPTASPSPSAQPSGTAHPGHSHHHRH